MESSHYQKYLKHMRHNTDASVRLAETHEVLDLRGRVRDSLATTASPPPPPRCAPDALGEADRTPPSRSHPHAALPCPSPGHVRGL